MKLFDDSVIVNVNVEDENGEILTQFCTISRDTGVASAEENAHYALCVQGVFEFMDAFFNTDTWLECDEVK